MINKYSVLGLLALFVSISSCAKNDIDAPQDPQRTHELEHTGEEVSLNLDAELQEDDLRAAVYNYNNTLTKGRTPKLILPEKVPVRVYVRKKGEAAATISTVTLEGKVRSTNKGYRVRVLGTLRLRKPGQSLKAGDWQVLCVIGGKSFIPPFGSKTQIETPQSDADPQLGAGNNANYDHVAHKVDPTAEWVDPTPRMSTYQGATKSYSDQDATQLLTMMPWMTDWSPLTTYKTDPSVEGAGQNLELHFKPKGVLLRIEPRSNMILDLKLNYIRIQQDAQNGALIFGGSFDMLQDHPEFKNEPYFYPTFMPATGNSPAKTFVQLQITDEPLMKAGEELKRTIYVWAMPKNAASSQNNPYLDIELGGYITEDRPANIFASSRLRDLYLGMWGANDGVQDPLKEEHSKNTATSFRTTYVTRQSVSNFVSGNTYTFRPILNSDLMITEVVVRPSGAPLTNDENDPVSGAVYKANWGGVELYNPTLTPINLADFGLVRVKAKTWDRNALEWYRFEAHPSNGTLELGHAVVQPLTFLNGEASKTMSGAAASNYVTKVRQIYAHSGYTPNNTLLMPGKTIMIMDASYVRYPSAKPSNINVDGVTSLGQQLDQAFNRHYCDLVIALDNGTNQTSKTFNSYENDAPVMAGGRQDSYILVKKNATGGYDIHDVAGTKPEENTTQFYNNGDHLATFWAGNRISLWGARHGREGNVRTRFVPVLSPNKDLNYNEWGFTPSLQRDGEYINRFSTLGSRYWLGPTEPSRLNEWNSVVAMPPVPTRKWRIQ